jgi:pantoate--beta-alanine ligase
VSLERFTTIADLRQHLDDLRYADGASIGLVPTMGALHEGHASLIAQAADDNHEVITTIFVNPLQFGANEDLAKYPRDLEADAAIAEAAGATILFAPTVEEMYPFGPANVLTSVSVRALTDVLDGVSRPGHFDGVATVVAKLFAIVGPCDAYFGEKDYQQLAVIRRMVTDLSFPVKVVGCPTVREASGLAMSSRNRYLTADERDGAAIIYRALQAGAKAVAEGNSGKFVETAMSITLPFGNVVKSVDYVACVDPLTLESVETITSEVRLLIAARVGTTRLIDNCAAFPQPKRSK